MLKYNKSWPNFLVCWSVNDCLKKIYIAFSFTFKNMCAGQNFEKGNKVCFA